ncbi:hypothetical protein PCASD_21536 [Puccinia coronata f. sp. avenae]|uniref:RCC1/BLIP-II protein n=1 Tax=Puccinia coronata f. sp. avenae TaxID=200324 RepID=A0A2N5TT99_9BASI|nr:hypothetical protein PCASD_21536 [Puccinia coronata f. sp. avenae]
MFSLFSAGSNSHKQLTTNTHQEDIREFRKTHEWENGNRSIIISSALGGRHSLFLTHQADIYACGDDSQGQILQPKINKNAANESDPLSQDTTLVKLDYKHILSRLPNINQQLKESLIRTYHPVQVAACWETSFVVLSYDDARDGGGRTGDEGDTKTCHDDYILAFGSDDSDLRGYYKTTPPSSEKESLNEANIIELPAKPDGLKKRRKIRLHATYKHVIALVEYEDKNNTTATSRSMQVVGWGAARHGQLGPLDPARASTPPRVLPIDFREDTTEMEAVKIATGKHHTVIVSRTRIWCWGSNRKGQLPLRLRELPPGEILELQATWNATFVILVDDDEGSATGGSKRLLGFGSNTHGQLGSSDPSLTVLDTRIPHSFARLVAGSEHLLITNESPHDHRHQVCGWGWNEHGNLGPYFPSHHPQHQQLQPLHTSAPMATIFLVPSSCRISHLAAGCATSFIFCSPQ